MRKKGKTTLDKNHQMSVAGKPSLSQEGEGKQENGGCTVTGGHAGCQGMRRGREG